MTTDPALSTGGDAAHGGHRARVAVVYTSPPTVVSDVRRVMQLAGFPAGFEPSAPVAVRPRLELERWYGTASTTPWQLDGVLRVLHEGAFSNPVAVYQAPAGIDTRRAEAGNKLGLVLDKFNVLGVHPVAEGQPWVRYAPKREIPELASLFPDGIEVPQVLIGRSVIHLPALKTDPLTGVSGAVKSGLGLLHPSQAVPPSALDGVLVGLLAVQEELHPHRFAVMDGTFVTEAASTGSVRAEVKNLLLASDDYVALDAVAARLLGFEPMQVEHIRLAHKRGLGTGEAGEIEVVGFDTSNVRFDLTPETDTLAAWARKKLASGPLRLMERPLTRSPLTPLAANVVGAYRRRLWYPAIGRARVSAARRSEWGRLFESY